MRPPHVQEVYPDYLTVGETTLLNAKRKADDVAPKFPNALVLAADTLVAVEGKIFGKPRDRAEAGAMLRTLSGREHDVFSGVWIISAGGGRTRCFIEHSRVRFRRLSGGEITRYLSLVNPLDKAGGYAAQENVLEIIESIEGSRTNVIGLPMEALSEALEEF